MSSWLKKWLKITAVLYGVFFWGAVVMREENVTTYMLFFLAGLTVFVVWRVLKMLVVGLKKMVLAIKDLLRTRYVIVFKF